MRLSVLKGDPGYDMFRARYADAYVNGVKIEHVVTADEELGLVVRYKTGEDGRFRDKTETVRGIVEIKFRYDKRGKNETV